MASTLAPIDAVRILLVCTANQCRSPMAEGLLRHRLAAAGVAADVRSAGLLPGGVAASAPAVRLLAARGIDLADHRSRTLDADAVGWADLVLGMERRHVREAVVLVPEAISWSFTLPDAVRRAEAAEPRRPGESVRGWAARLAAGRTRRSLFGEGDDSVADPMGGTTAMYERTAEELDDLLARLVARALAPAADAQPAVEAPAQPAVQAPVQAPWGVAR